MKKFNLDQIVRNVRKMLYTKSSMEHMSEAYAEGFQAMLGALGVDPDTVTILSGAEVSDGAITAGWAAYQNEIFQIDAASLPTDLGTDVLVWNIESTYRASDPILFDDGSSFNVHEIRKLILEAGSSGSTIADWDETDDYTKVSEPSNPSFRYLKTKVIEIGDWDLDDGGAAVSGISVTHGLSDWKKIRNITLLIRNDDDTERVFPLKADQSSGKSFQVFEILLNTSNGSAISITLNGGHGADWDSTNYNRGWLTIEYEE